eukprot:1158960-Pelagomonas_calceolata.AAC.5
MPVEVSPHMHRTLFTCQYTPPPDVVHLHIWHDTPPSIAMYSKQCYITLSSAIQDPHTALNADL